MMKPTLQAILFHDSISSNWVKKKNEPVNKTKVVEQMLVKMYGQALPVNSRLTFRKLIFLLFYCVPRPQKFSTEFIIFEWKLKTI